MKNAKTISGTPRITSTKICEMTLQTLFFTTPIIPKSIPIMQAKNNPSNAKSSVRPNAIKSIGPYTVIILNIKTNLSIKIIWAGFIITLPIIKVYSPRYLAIISSYFPLDLIFLRPALNISTNS